MPLNPEQLASALGGTLAPLYLLAGGVLASWDLFAPPMMAEVRKRSITYRETKTRIEKARLGNKAGIFGAAYLPIQATQNV